MVSTTSMTLSAIGLALVATSTSVDAHGTLAQPPLKFTGTAYGGDFSALVPMTALKPQAGDIFTNYPDANKNAAAFGRAFKASTYKSLKEFLLKNQDMAKGRSKMPKTAECGFTDPTGGAVQRLPAQLEWYGGGMNHPGPCEVWCDDEIVVPFDTNCAQTHPDGKFTYDKAKCEGKSRLTMYWMSTLLEWQVYIDCAKIGTGGSAGAGGNAKPAPAPAPAPAPGAAPATTPKAPASGPAPAPASGPAPAPAAGPATTPKAPASTPKAPAPSPGGDVGGEAKAPSSGKGCKRKLRD